MEVKETDVTITLKSFLDKCQSDVTNLKSKVNSNGIYDVEPIKKVYSSIKIVLGNEACDLDSAVCALAYSYFLHFLDKDNETTIVIPMLNISRSDFEIRTEVQYWLEKSNVSSTLLHFRDELDLKQLVNAGNVDLYLVDHNVLSPEDEFLEPFICSIIDHHLIERTNTPVYGMVIEPVGSCSTLVAEVIMEKSPEIMDSDLANLLYGATLMDTINFSKTAKKTTPKDIIMAEQLETILQIEPQSRTETFEELVRVKGDISGLSSKNILRKDLKTVSANSLTIALSSVPLLAQEYLSREGVEQDLQEALDDNLWDILVLLGIQVANNSVRRDLAIFSGRASHHEQICFFLETTNDGILDLNKLELEIPGNCSLYEQNNCVASRKVVLPLVRCWLDRQR